MLFNDTEIKVLSNPCCIYRLIGNYRRFGTVEALVPKWTGRKAGIQVISKAIEKIISETFHNVYLKPTRPTLTAQRRTAFRTGLAHAKKGVRCDSNKPPPRGRDGHRQDDGARRHCVEDGPERLDHAAQDKQERGARSA